MVTSMGDAVAHPAPYTVDDLYALPDDGMRHELLDGTLLVSPPPAVAHQLAAGRLVDVLSRAAPADIEVLEATGVELPAGLLVPDVVVAAAPAVHRAGRTLAAADVRAVVEIVSPSSRRADRTWKPEAYAEGGIATYWRVELDAPGGAEGYARVAHARAGAVTLLPEPFPVALDPAWLSGPLRR
jgi:Uma2 family endonuclease